MQTLLAVDEMVESVVLRLTENKAIDNTYFIYTSDNGFHIGFYRKYFEILQFTRRFMIQVSLRSPGTKDSRTKRTLKYRLLCEVQKSNRKARIRIRFLSSTLRQLFWTWLIWKRR